MSFDPSRMLYPHIGCGTWPCSCVWDHQPLHVLTFPCRFCAATFVHLGDYEAHRLDAHERPLLTAEGVVIALPLLVPVLTPNGTTSDVPLSRAELGSMCRCRHARLWHTASQGVDGEACAREGCACANFRKPSEEAML